MDTPLDTPQLRETDYLKGWALFFACATVGGAIAGAIAGGLLGGVLGATGASETTIKVACGIVGFIAAIPVSYFSFRFFVSRFLVQKLTSRRASGESTNVD